MNQYQRGFTLTETLVVLSAFMILASVTVFSLKPQNTRLEEKKFFKQLKADLYYAQNYAISHQHEVSVIVIPNQYRYYMILSYGEKPIVDRNYSTNFYITEGTMPLYFKFQHDGNVNQFGSIIIHSKNKIFRLVVLIGKGRFYVTES